MLKKYSLLLQLNIRLEMKCLKVLIIITAEQSMENQSK